MENKRFSKNAILTIPNLISLFRILLIPLILLFSRFWAEMGVFIAEPVADTLAVTITVLLFISNRKSVFGNPKLAPEQKKPTV